MGNDTGNDKDPQTTVNSQNNEEQNNEKENKGDTKKAWYRKFLFSDTSPFIISAIFILLVLLLLILKISDFAEILLSIIPIGLLFLISVIVLKLCTQTMNQDSDSFSATTHAMSIMVLILAIFLFIITLTFSLYMKDAFIFTNSQNVKQSEDSSSQQAGKNQQTPGANTDKSTTNTSHQ